MRILTYLKKLIPTWKKDEDVRAENAYLVELINQVMDMNRGLNMSAGEIWRQTEALKEESVQLLSAITFQYGGELVVKSEFFDVLAEPVNNNLQLQIRKEENGNVTLKLIPVEPEEEEEEK